MGHLIFFLEQKIVCLEQQIYASQENFTPIHLEGMGAGASREEGIALLPCYRPYNTNTIRIFILIRTTAHGLPNKKIVFADLANKGQNDINHGLFRNS